MHPLRMTGTENAWCGPSTLLWEMRSERKEWERKEERKEFKKKTIEDSI